MKLWKAILPDLCYDSTIFDKATEAILKENLTLKVQVVFEESDKKMRPVCLETLPEQVTDKRTHSAPLQSLETSVWRNSPTLAGAASFLRFLDHIQ